MRGFLFVAVLLTIISCDETRVYEKNVDLDNKLWLADSSINATFSITDNTEPYNIYFNLRNTVSYPYENIYITYYLKDSTAAVIRKRLVDFNLFDPKTGVPYGSGLGDIYDHQFLLMKNHRFKSVGTYHVEIEQYMRTDSLPEILSAGVRVAFAQRQDQ